MVSGKTIPSLNVPFTDQDGRINPIWHEFLRSFVEASVDGSITVGGSAQTIIAGNGIVSTEAGTTTTLRVGQGQGIAVNADDVSVDIASQAFITPALDDEVLISDVSDNNTVKKTQVRNIVGLSAPGGLTSQVQYNSGDLFAGDSGLTYNGAGTLSINGKLAINGGTFDTSVNTEMFVFRVPTGAGTNHFTFTQSGVGSSSLPLVIGSLRSSTNLIIDNDMDVVGSTLAESIINFKGAGISRWNMGLTGGVSNRTFVIAGGGAGLNTGQVITIDETDRFFTHNTSMMRTVTAALSASTTRTQGQGALVSDICVVATCANVNDTVTLPAAVAGRHCLVINNGAQTLQVFPASGDNLGAGLDTSTTIVTTSRKWFVAFDNTNWEPVI